MLPDSSTPFSSPLPFASPLSPLPEPLSPPPQAARTSAMALIAVMPATRRLDPSFTLSLVSSRRAPRGLRGTEPTVNTPGRSEEHTSELQSRGHLVCRLLLEIKQHTYKLLHL